jgi:cytochrome c-type biogenesis protein CcmE
VDLVNPAGPSSALDDEASADELGGATLDLSPRTPPPGRGPRSAGGDRRSASGRKWPWIVVLVAIVGCIAFVVSHAITDATLYFYNADEAVAKQQDLGLKRFRLQGTVVAGSKKQTADGVSFVVDFNGVDVPVNHVGDPPQLFQDRIPVVLEGHFASTAPGAAFASDRILVKHTEEYEEKNEGRIKEAEQGGHAGADAQKSP